MDQYVQRNLRLIQQQMEKLNRQYPKQHPLSRQSQQLLATKPKQFQQTQPPRKPLELYSITGCMQFWNQNQSCKEFILVDDQNQSIQEQQFSLNFDDQFDKSSRSVCVDLSIPQKCIKIIHRDQESWSEILPQTPGTRSYSRPPFSVLNQPQIVNREPFSPQYHIQSVYRHISLDTPGAIQHADAFDFSSLHDEAPPLQFDKPPKNPKKGISGETIM